MQVRSLFATAGVASAAVALLAGCSGSGSSPSSSLPTTNSAQSHARTFQTGLRASGIAPAFLLERRLFQAVHVVPDRVKEPVNLYVSDATGAVDVLNRKDKEVRTITNGLEGPDGEWVDNKGNLYVADYGAIDVAEYAKGGSSPKSTYTGEVDPIGVSTDSSGKVYVADFNLFNAPSMVEVYAQGSNSIIQTYAIPGGSAESTAFDSKGNLYVDYANPNTALGGVIEFPKGSTSGTDLGLTLGFPGGMVLDKNDNIVVCDQTGGSVDVFPQGATSPSKTYGGFEDPFHVTLNAKDGLLFVADNEAGTVAVLHYPAGTAVKTLGAANGITDAFGVAAAPPSPG